MLTDADCPPGITAEQVTDWYDRFRFYRHPPSKAEILSWIKQFSADDYAIATTVLDNVVLISDYDIQQGFHDALHAVPGWSTDEKLRPHTWAFVGLGGQAESGTAMLHMFREANGLTADKHQHLFVTPADLPGMKLTAEDTVVFVDDFSGTGEQFRKRWDVLRELVSSEARTYLFLAVVTDFAFNVLTSLEDIKIVARKVLPIDANVFSNTNTMLDADGKAKLLSYCKKADRRAPKGWGECGLLLVISRKTPNNSIPILHVCKKSWTGVFPRSMQVKKANPAAAL